ncbi:MAG: PTS mannitol transporter subunit IICBA [Gorillibacterium sp.]|nr:PTS mannitol transporter subunit IICBA [Gorillibacterium sp.]
MSTAGSKKSSSALQVGVQKFGRFLSGMVLPNIGAFIAWGLITALFIPTGYFPNVELAKFVDPMINYLLPLLIAYTGGKMVHESRGAVIGSIAAMGVIVGTAIPMFMGAMIMGPLAAWLLKKFDKMIQSKIKSGFEMLVNNFSLGILGAILAILAFFIIGPTVEGISNVLSRGVQSLINSGLIPLVNILIEPGKILFLNNAINHGVLTPIGLQDVKEHGKSILFMLESNPGPGFGILLAYMFAGRGIAKQSASGAAIIHFFGGIHEIYFPYVMMNPRLILAAIAGGVTGSFTFTILDAGLVGSPSPGSIFAYMAMAPKGGFLVAMSGVITATLASFIVAYLLLKTSKKTEEDDLEEATAMVRERKAIGTNPPPAQAAGSAATTNEKTKADIQKIVFACDAGMGSSAMGASMLRKKFQQAGVSVTVINKAINEIPLDADIVITQKQLTDRARLRAPNAEHIAIDNFMKSPAYDELVTRLS